MAYVIVHEFSGGTPEQYDAAIASVHPADGGLPDGQTFHAAGPIDDGFAIVAVHDSKESWESFRDGTLVPGLAAMGDEALAGPPREISFEAHNVQQA